MNLEILKESFKNYLKDTNITEEDLFKGNLETRISNISWFINYTSDNWDLNYLYSHVFKNETEDNPFLMITWNIRHWENYNIDVVLTYNLKLIPENKEELFEIIIRYEKQAEEIENDE